MANGYPCPNPTCSHVFPAALLGAPSLSCPRCGVVFQFQVGAPRAPVYPTAKPAGAPPLPVAEVTGYPSSYPPPDDDSGPRRRRGVGLGWLKVLVVLLLFGGAGAWAVWEFGFNDPAPKKARFVDSTIPGIRIFHSDQLNFTFEIQKDIWKSDADLKEVIPGTLLAMRRSNPDGWFILWAKDYKKYTPRDGEVLDETHHRLAKHFNGLEYEAKSDADLAGRAAIRLGFQGEAAKAGKVAGEISVLTYQGIAYVLVTWSPQPLPELDELRKRFALLKGREEWTEADRKAEVFQGKRMLYTVSSAAGRWTARPTMEQFFAADLVIQATNVPDPRYVARLGTVLTFVYPKQGNLRAGADLARQHLEKTHRKDYPGTKIEVLSAVQDAIGEVDGYITKLRVVNGPDLVQYVVQGVVVRSEGTLVIQGQCPWERKKLWESDFDQVIGSLRVR